MRYLLATLYHFAFRTEFLYTHPWNHNNELGVCDLLVRQTTRLLKHGQQYINNY